MAPKKPRRATVPTGALYDVPAIKRYKSVQQTTTPRTRGGGHHGPQVVRSAPKPLPAVRRRGSAFGHYAPDDPGIAQFPSIDPTRTTNPERPRTLQAGYYKERGAATGVLRVRFRDGTPWEYHGVPPNVWRNFKRVQSPGRFINRVLNQYDYQRGDF